MFVLIEGEVKIKCREKDVNLVRVSKFLIEMSHKLIIFSFKSMQLRLLKMFTKNNLTVKLKQLF
jgi:hypothetical protein